MAKAPSAMEDMAPIVAEPRIIKLSTGYELLLVRLKTRQFFRLLKVLTHGAGDAMLRSGLNFATDAAQFGQGLLTLILFSIPDAEQETIDFIGSMCHPPPGALVEDKPPSAMNKQEQEHNAEAWGRHATELNNPTLDDMVTIVEAIVEQEAPEIQSLGKRIQKMLDLYLKTGQDKEPAPDQLSPEAAAASAQPLTSSPAITDGATSTSSTSPSAASGKSSPASANGGSRSSSETPG